MKIYFNNFASPDAPYKPGSRPNESSVCAYQVSRNVDKPKGELPVGCLLSIDFLASR
jgi:hypothetical protein